MDSKVHDERLALEAPLFANNFRGFVFDDFTARINLTPKVLEAQKPLDQ